MRELHSKFAIVVVMLMIGTPIFGQSRDPQSIVAKHRGTSQTLSPADAPKVLKAIAADLNTDFSNRPSGSWWGILVKTSGNNCGGYSCDIICRTDGQHWDVFIDGPDGGTNQSGSATPSWQDKGFIEPARCEVIRPGGTEPPPNDPPPPGPDMDAILGRLQTLIEMQDVQIDLLERQLREQEIQSQALQQAIVDLKTEIAKGIKIRW